MASQDIAMRYRRSVLGPFWISITIAVMALSMSWLYSHIFNIPYMDHLPHFALGIVAWNFLAALLNESTGVVLEHEGIVRNVPMSIPVMAAKMVERNFIIFLHNIAAIVALLLAFGFHFGVVSLMVIPGVFAYCVLGLLLSGLLGPICTRYRDVALIVANVTQVLFFITPILWKTESVRGKMFVVNWNPVFHLVEVVRAPLLGTMPTLLNWAVTIGFISIIGIASLISLGIMRRKIYLWL